MVVLTLRRRSLVAGGALATALVVALLILAMATDVVAGKPRVAYRWNHVPTSGQQSVSADALSARETLIVEPIWQIIVVHELFGEKFTPVDVGKKGDSVGDYGVFRDKIAEANTNEVIGTIDVMCVSGYADMCNATLRIPGRGQINANGITPLGVDPDRFPITGGTGEFVGVGGVMLVEFPSDEYALLTFTLTH